MTYVAARRLRFEHAADVAALYDGSADAILELYTLANGDVQEATAFVHVTASHAVRLEATRKIRPGWAIKGLLTFWPQWIAEAPAHQPSTPAAHTQAHPGQAHPISTDAIAATPQA